MRRKIFKTLLLILLLSLNGCAFGKTRFIMPAAGKQTTVQTMQEIKNAQVMGFDKNGNAIIGYVDVPKGAYITSGGQEVQDSDKVGDGE